VVHALNVLVDEGNVLAPRPELEARAAEMLSVDGTHEAIDALVQEGALILDGDAVYLPRLYRAEVELAQQVGRLLDEPARAPQLRAADTARLSEGQKRALDQLRASTVAVLTGGPGTGKTTVTRAVVQGWEAAKKKVLLAAPTGRAAKRLSDATGRTALTVHRLLEWGKKEGGSGPFGRDRKHPLQCDLLIVDEASMLDLPLARGLFDAVPPGAHVLLVGDVDQLPPVGAGQVLADVIASGRTPVARLTEVFRQAEGSGIVENAYRILRGETPVGAGRDEKGDFYVIPVEDPERARDLVLRMCKQRIPEAFGFDPVRDVQVLTPMHRGAAGTEELNKILQGALNPRTDGVTADGRRFAVGDKVMQIRNDYDRDVFNGDLGRVTQALDEEGELTVTCDFDGKHASYEGDDLDELELAYAVSVHKSQGSEYPVVVLVLLMQHYMLLRRNLFYTAVTRGKKLVVVVGEPRAIKRAVEDAHVEPRHSRLSARLRSP
jgi:exodeoxyribonuclease V alpha subunit